MAAGDVDAEADVANAEAAARLLMIAHRRRTIAARNQKSHSASRKKNSASPPALQLSAAAASNLAANDVSADLMTTPSQVALVESGSLPKWALIETSISHLRRPAMRWLLSSMKTEVRNAAVSVVPALADFLRPR